jgi:hypothetical protein
MYYIEPQYICQVFLKTKCGRDFPCRIAACQKSLAEFGGLGRQIELKSFSVGACT